MNHPTRLLIPVAALGLTAALAQAKAPLEVPLAVFRVFAEVKDGKTIERFEAAEAADPGAVLEYRLRAVNRGEVALRSVRAELPVPRGAEYLDGTATVMAAATLQATFDGKTFAAPPLKRRVVRDGKTVEETVKPTEYRALRWVAKGELAPGAVLEMKARVKVK